MYHDGGLTGVKVKLMFQKIDIIMNDFRDKILSVDYKAASGEEVGHVLEA